MLSIKGYEELEKSLKKVIKNTKTLTAVMEIISNYVNTNPLQKAYDKPRKLKECIHPTKKKQTETEKERAKRGVYIRTEADSMRGDKNNPNG